MTCQNMTTCRHPRASKTDATNFFLVSHTVLVLVPFANFAFSSPHHRINISLRRSLFPVPKPSSHFSDMDEPKSTFAAVRGWMVEHKLRTVGSLWLTGIAGSFAYNWSKPNMKPSLKIIHARLHAQGLTLAALAGAAVVEWYDNKSEAKPDRSPSFLPANTFAHKD